MEWLWVLAVGGVMTAFFLGGLVVIGRANRLHDEQERRHVDPDDPSQPPLPGLPT